MNAADIRLACRAIRNQPLVSIVVTLSLGVAIGFATFLFALDRATRNAPVAYADPAHLYEIRVSARGPYADELRREFVRVLASSEGPLQAIATQRWAPPPVVQVGLEQRELALAVVSPNYFTLLGVRPVAGRLFQPTGHAATERGVILSRRLATILLPSVESVASSFVTINGVRRRILGVAPRLVPSVTEPDLWELSVPGDSVVPGGPTTIYARLRRGSSLATARDAVGRAAFVARSTILGPGASRRSLVGSIHPSRRPAVGIPNLQVLLIGIAISILLIACANVGGVLVMQAIRRRHELAVRAALGAPRRHLVRQVLIEGAVLVTLGTVAGWLIGVTLSDTLGRAVIAQLHLPPETPWTDGRAFAFALGMGAAMVAVCTLLPVIRATTISAGEVLKSYAGTMTARNNRALASCLSVEIALTVVLLAVTGSLVRSLAGTVSPDAGVDRRGLYLLQLNLHVGIPRAGHGDTAAATAKRLETERGNATLLAAARRIPGVMAAASSWSESIAGDVLLPEGGHAAALSSLQVVTPDFFRVVRAASVAGDLNVIGRDAGDDAVIDDVLAMRLWGDAPALGRTVQLGNGSAPRTVRVAAVIRHLPMPPSTHEFEEAGALYLMSNRVPVQSSILIRAAMSGGGMQHRIAQALHEAAPATAFSTPTPLSALYASKARVEAFITSLVLSITLVGVALSALGIYGLVLYAVLQRQREIGLRLALGAARWHVIRIVVGGAARVSVIGVAAGCVLSLAAVRIVSATIFGVRVIQPVTLVAGIFALALIAVLATWLPTRRALAMNAAVLLRDY